MKKSIMSFLIIVSLVLSMLAIFPSVSAGTNVTTTWIVPGDTTISVTFPTGEGKIEFDCDSKDPDKQGASSQTAVVAALNISNDGNTALEINASWSAAWPSGVTHVNISAGDNTNSTSFTFTSANCQTNQTLNDSLDVDEYENYWFWTSGTDIAETAGVDRTLVIYARNV